MISILHLEVLKLLWLRLMPQSLVSMPIWTARKTYESSTLWFWYVFIFLLPFFECFIVMHCSYFYD